MQDIVFLTVRLIKVIIIDMARKKEFDEKHVLLAAAQVFATHGYAGTSIDQLVKATGLLWGSLYGTFYSKAELFNTSLRQQLQGDDEPLLIDLVIIALLERVNVDKNVKEMIEKWIENNTSNEKNSFQDSIAARILARANLSIGEKGE